MMQVEVRKQNQNKMMKKWKRYYQILEKKGGKK